MALITSYCIFLNSRLGFPNFVTENSWNTLCAFVAILSRRLRLRSWTHDKNPVIRNALSQSLLFPVPLDKGNEDSGNEIEDHFECLVLAQAQLRKPSHFTSLSSSQSAVFALCRCKLSVSLYQNNVEWKCWYKCYFNVNESLSIFLKDSCRDLLVKASKECSKPGFF